MLKEIFISSMFCISVLVLCACQSFDVFSAPYALVDSKIFISEKSEAREKIFLDFTLRNDTKLPITSFVISCSLVDSEGNSVFENSSCIVEKIFEYIPSESESDFRIAIDSYFFELPSDSYSVDFFYLREIKFENGSSWTDPYGMYSTSLADFD